MTTCFNCDSKFDPSIYGEAAPACPHCGRLPANEVADMWQDAARVTSLAEAGYLVNLLGTIGVSARIFDDRSFSALGGAWEQAYVIQVPDDQIRQAAGLLRNESEAAECEEGDEKNAKRFYSDEENLVFWRPVALMALAGVASFVVGQRFASQNGDGQRRPYAESLVAAMENAGSSLVTEPDGSGVRHRFQYHRHRRSWTMQSDLNGDGRFDAIREFRGPVVLER